MNPFAPTFGVSPPLLVGRQDILDDFAEALAGGAGSPSRAMLVTGLRGTGKTVMLNALEDAARAAGWEVVSETATPGLLDRLVHESLPALLRHHDPDARSTRLTGIDVAHVGGAQVERTEAHEVRPGLRGQVTRAAEVLAARGGGLLVTVDEVQRRQIDDLRQVGAVVQHMFREGREVAFVAAGLPSSVADLLGDDVLTFLRRADRRHLGAVSPDDVELALRVPIEQQGHRIEDDALAVAVAGTQGYPFMVQLVGWHAWAAAGGAEVIDAAAAARGAERAARKVGALVHAPAVADVSDVDRTFLLAMAQDDGPSRIRDVAERMGVASGYANVYRARLLNAELIRAAGHGKVDFTLPGLRGYLREHASSSWDPGAF